MATLTSRLYNLVVHANAIKSTAPVQKCRNSWTLYPGFAFLIAKTYMLANKKWDHPLRVKQVFSHSMTKLYVPFEWEMLYHRHLSVTCQIRPLPTFEFRHHSAFANSMLWLVEFYGASVVNQSAYKLLYINSCDPCFSFLPSIWKKHGERPALLRHDEANQIL